MTTLFINACMRGAQSRTLSLCREYLSTRQAVSEVDLTTLDLKPFNSDMVAFRGAKQKAEEWSDPIFDLAHQFASADEIVIGAPYWDMSFPAVVKIYMEHVSVANIAFYYTKDAVCLGKCKASKLTYITTCGGFLDGENAGYKYFCAIAKMFGIPETRYVSAEGLDIVGLSVNEQMDKARAVIAKLD